MLKKIIIVLAFVLVGAYFFLENYVPPLSDKHGGVQTKLYLGEGENQPLVVGFGGGSGGNDWARNYMSGKRQELLRRGYAVLAIGYFNVPDAPNNLDRISLEAIADTILNIAARHDRIDETKIALIGASKGGELVLNLASRFDEFGAVVAMSTAHVSFPAITIMSNTSSWSFRGEEVPYAPAPYSTIGPALRGDLYTAHSIMLEDEDAVKKAEIAVEKINGAILLLSAMDDEAWPAKAMSDRIMTRLAENDFSFPYEHIVLEGGHIAPLDHFDQVYQFLDEHLE